MMIQWVLSDNPADWASQLTAAFTVVAALLTGAYVWLTYRLLKATAQVAQLALADTQRRRVGALLPIRQAITTALAQLQPLRSDSSDKIAESLSVVTAWLARERYTFDAYADRVATIDEVLSSELIGVRNALHDTYAAIARLVGRVNTGASLGEVTRIIDQTDAVLRSASDAIDAELAASRKVLKVVSV